MNTSDEEDQHQQVMDILEQARSQGGRWGQSPPQKKREREKKKENKVACMHVKLPPFNHFQSIKD